ncbi:hypothetical protein [Catenovulum sediminis]|uniref:hypothetical protein n=1 Tax=Catenovulum sediminis TaxID=1740262 RepID=UPI001180720D|nr:hypothetical protein [Catenovulum sediminis]
MIIYEFQGIQPLDWLKSLALLLIFFVLIKFRSKLKWPYLFIAFWAIFTFSKFFELSQIYLLAETYKDKKLLLNIEGQVKDIEVRGHYEFIDIGNYRLKNKVLGGGNCFYNKLSDLQGYENFHFKIKSVHKKIGGESYDCILYIKKLTEL